MKNYYYTWLSMVVISFLCTAASVAEVRTIAIPEGTVIPAKMEDRLSTQTSRRGDVFYVKVSSSADYYNRLPKNTRIKGVVKDVQRGYRDKPGSIVLRFTEIITPDGRTSKIDGYPADLKNLNRDRDGRLYVRSGSSTDPGTYVLIGAITGFIIGSKDRKYIEGAVLGAMAGGIIAAASKSGNNDGNDVVLSRNADIGVYLKKYVHVKFEIYDDWRNDNRNNPSWRDWRDKDKNDYTIKYNYRTLNLREQETPREEYGTIYLPLKKLLNEMNIRSTISRFRVGIQFETRNGKVIAESDSRTYYIDGKRCTLRYAIKSYGNEIFAPIEFFEKTLYARIEWDKWNKTIIIRR